MFDARSPVAPISTATRRDGCSDSFREALLTGNVSRVLDELSAATAAGITGVASSVIAGGYTLLMLAASCEDEIASVALIRALLAAGADVAAVDDDGRTALHWASSRGSAARVEVLLAAGSAVNARTRSTLETPLHEAARYGRAGAVEALLRAGADATVRSRAHLSSWDVAGTFESPPNADCRARVVRALAAGSPGCRTGLFWHKDCLAHEPRPGHQEAPERITAILAAVFGSENSVPRFSADELSVQAEPPMATPVQVLRAHSPRYWRLLRALARHVERSGGSGVPFTPMVQRGLRLASPTSEKAGAASDTTFGAGTLPAALRAAGAACAAVDAVVNRTCRNALCVVRPPGHHAGVNGLLTDSESTVSCGFCVLNSVGIAALHALDTHRDVIRRVAIVDFDVHHGNGTEEIVRKWADARHAAGDTSQGLFFFSSHLYDVERRPVANVLAGTSAESHAQPHPVVVSPVRTRRRAHVGVGAGGPTTASAVDTVDTDATAVTRGMRHQAPTGGHANSNSFSAVRTKASARGSGTGGENAGPFDAGSGERRGTSGRPALDLYVEQVQAQPIERRGKTNRRRSRADSLAGDDVEEAKEHEGKGDSTSSARGSESESRELAKGLVRHQPAQAQRKRKLSSASDTAKVVAASKQRRGLPAEVSEEPSSLDGCPRRAESAGAEHWADETVVDFDRSLPDATPLRPVHANLKVDTRVPESAAASLGARLGHVAALAAPAVGQLFRTAAATAAAVVRVHIGPYYEAAAPTVAEPSASHAIASPPAARADRTSRAHPAIAVQPDADDSVDLGAGDSSNDVDPSLFVREAGICMTPSVAPTATLVRSPTYLGPPRFPLLQRASSSIVGFPASSSRHFHEGGTALPSHDNKDGVSKVLASMSPRKFEHRPCGATQCADTGHNSSIKPYPCGCAIDGDPHIASDAERTSVLCAHVFESRGTADGLHKAVGTAATPLLREDGVQSVHIQKHDGKSSDSCHHVLVAREGVSAAPIPGASATTHGETPSTVGGADEITYSFYPGTGAADCVEANVINAPLPPLWRLRPDQKAAQRNPERATVGRLALRRIVAQRLVPALRAFDPDLILVSAGFDGAAGDVGNTRADGKV